MLSNTLDLRIPQFRNGDWLPIQFTIESAIIIHGNDVAADGSWTSLQRVTDRPDLFAPFRVHVDGVAVLDASQGFNGLQPGNSSQLEAFYLVVSARTGALSSDAHAVSGVRLECRPAASAADFVVIVVATPSSEGSDRPNLDLSPSDDALVIAVTAANPKTAVVIKKKTVV
jgi:hypothetical protein